MEADKVVAAKFDELIARRKSDHGISSFTQLERAIWLLIVIRCDIDMGGFGSVFEQSLQRAEIIEAIGYMRALGLTNIAALFEQTISLLDANNFYKSDGTLTYKFLVNEIDEFAFEAIADQVVEGDLLWTIDDKFAELLLAGATDLKNHSE